jgi:uncharacterized RDD family membrane protein YckC
MAARFDEVELEAVPFAAAPDAVEEISLDAAPPAPIMRRSLALLIDLSLFAALAIALSPLLPGSRSWTSLLSLAGFVLVISYYYFVGSWLLWGRTIGGAIFDVRIIDDTLPAMVLGKATARWAALYLTVATGGVGFLFALLPSRRSLADRLSHTHAVDAG